MASQLTRPRALLKLSGVVSLDLVRFYRRSFRLVFLVALIAGISAFLLVGYLPNSFEASTSFFVSREAQPLSNNFYSYDGYYLEQAAERFAETVAALLKSQELVRAAASESRLPASPLAIEQLTTGLRVKRLGPQLLKVSFSSGRRETALSFTKNLSAAAKDFVIKINEKGDPYLSLQVLEENPFVVERRFSPLISALASFLTVFFLSFLVFTVSEINRGSD